MYIITNCSDIEMTAKLTAKLADFYSQRRTPANNLTRDKACLAARTSPYKKRHEYGIISYYIMPGLTYTEPLEKIPKCLMSLTNEILICYTSTKRVSQIRNRMTMVKAFQTTSATSLD